MIIVDTNIIFSALLNADSDFLPILLDDKIKFVAPSFLFVELFNHKEKIFRYSKLGEEKLLVLLNELLSNIQFISHNIISKYATDRAYEICRDIDEKDTIFIAMVLEFNGLMWTGDKKLITALKKKGFDKFYIP